MAQHIVPDPSRTEIVYDRETHDFAMYLGGDLVGFARTYAEADATLEELKGELVAQGYIAPQPPYAALLDAAGDPPVDIPDEPDDAPPGGDEPPDIWYALTSEQRGEIEHLYRCHLGQHIRDWAYIDALAAYVRRALRDTLPLDAGSPAPTTSPEPAAGTVGAPQPCEVNGCAEPGHTVWIGRWPCYAVWLCERHDARKGAA